MLNYYVIIVILYVEALIVFLYLRRNSYLQDIITCVSLYIICKMFITDFLSHSIVIVV